MARTWRVERVVLAARLMAFAQVMRVDGEMLNAAALALADSLMEEGGVKMCEDCNGHGALDDVEAYECVACKGTGYG